MPTLNDATAVYVGATPAQAVYLGDVKVWPSKPFESTGTFHGDIASLADPASHLVVALDGVANTVGASATLTVQGTHTPPQTAPPGKITTGVYRHASCGVSVNAWDLGGPLTTYDHVQAGFVWWPGSAAMPARTDVFRLKYDSQDVLIQCDANGWRVASWPPGNWLAVPGAGWLGFLFRADTDVTLRLDLFDGHTWRTLNGPTPLDNPENENMFLHLSADRPPATDPILTAAHTIVGGSLGQERTPLETFRPAIEHWYVNP